MDCLTCLRIIKEEIGKEENNARLEIWEIKDMIRKALEKFQIEKTEELERKLRQRILLQKSLKNR